jgi:hypothetical protein
LDRMVCADIFIFSLKIDLFVVVNPSTIRSQPRRDSELPGNRRDYVLLELYFCVIIGPNVSCINNIAVCSVDVQHSVQDRTTGEKHY